MRIAGAAVWHRVTLLFLLSFPSFSTSGCRGMAERRALICKTPPSLHHQSPRRRNRLAALPILLTPLPESLETMPKRRREYDCTTGSSEINKPQELVDTLEEQFGYSNTTGQGVWSEISKEVASKLSKSVFAIASFHGDEMRCSCSGIVIYWRRDLITLLTSASLVRSFHDESKIDEDLTIKVWNQHYQYVDGWLEQYDLHYNIALVNIPSTSFLCPANLHHQIQLESMKLMATSGIVMDKVSRFGSEEFLISTCKISKAGTGRPLVDFNGNFLGMNLYDAEQTTVLRRNIIIKFLERLGIFQPQHKQGGRRTSDIMVRSTNNGVYLSTNSHFDPLGVQGELMKGDLFVRANFLCSRLFCNHMSFCSAVIEEYRSLSRCRLCSEDSLFRFFSEYAHISAKLSCPCNHADVDMLFRSLTDLTSRIDTGEFSKQKRPTPEAKERHVVLKQTQTTAWKLQNCKEIA